MEIDARGLSCPQPIIETKKVIDKSDKSFGARGQYLSQGKCHQFAKAMKYEVVASETEYGWKLDLKKQ